MSNNTTISSWHAQERLAFIESCLWWAGSLNRRNLCEKFRISAQQASADLAAYRELHPEAIDYDLPAHRFIPGPNFQPALIDSSDLRKALSLFLPAEAWAEVTLPLRKKETAIVRRLLQAIREHESLEIEYFSLHSGTHRWRRIAPHAYGTDGLRWHVRAWCFENHAYRDFLPGRMAAVRDPQPFTPPQPDAAWHTLVELRFAPAPHLEGAARRAVEMDYGMDEGVLCAPPTREAMSGYLLRRFNFPEDAAPGAVNTSRTLQFLEKEIL